MKTCIHIGSESIDKHAQTQAETDAVIAAIVQNIPSVTHIAIGTYLDYPTIIGRWATSIHNAGRKMWLRSAGYNDWQGTNSVAQYASADFDAHAQDSMTNFLNANYLIFRSGDIVSPVPDEPENNSMWASRYGTIGSGSGKTVFNAFIHDSIGTASDALTNNGVTGVSTAVVGTNPSVSRDVITSATAALLDHMLVDAYPEHNTTSLSGDINFTTPTEIARSHIEQINRWVTGSQSNKSSHYTFGESIYVQLEQGVQAEVYRETLFAITKATVNLDGVTIWQFGATDNAAKSRLFDYTNSVWVPRYACRVVDRYFKALNVSATPFTRIPLDV